MRKNRICAAVLLVVSCLMVPAVAGNWLHVHIQEHGDATVVNLPIDLIEAFIPTIEHHTFGRGRGRVFRHSVSDGWDIDDLREIWRSYRGRSNMEFLKVQSRRNSLRIGIFDGDVVIRSNDRDRSETEVRVPGSVMDALLMGPDDGIDIAAAIRALNDLGEGIYVTAHDGDTHVRVWVDGRSDQ